MDRGEKKQLLRPDHQAFIDVLGQVDAKKAEVWEV